MNGYPDNHVDAFKLERRLIIIGRPESCPGIIGKTIGLCRSTKKILVQFIVAVFIMEYLDDIFSEEKIFFYTCPRASTTFCLAARLAGMIAANKERKSRQSISTNRAWGTRSTTNGTGVEIPGGV